MGEARKKYRNALQQFGCEKADLEKQARALLAGKRRIWTIGFLWGMVAGIAMMTVMFVAANWWRWL